MNKISRTLIIRHKRENLKKCSLRGLEGKSGIDFLSYPHTQMPDLDSVILLTMDAPPLTSEDGMHSLLVLDATWKLAQKMESTLGLLDHPLRRSLPIGFRTAYPRRQTDCPCPELGLASIEALFVAHLILKRESAYLLEGYHWKEEFLSKNKELLFPHLC
jgi:pre-rRNA-processing protein TSR3